MRALLVHQGLESALVEEEDPKTVGSSISDEKMKQIHNTLILSLSDSVLGEILEKKTLSVSGTKWRLCA